MYKSIFKKEWLKVKNIYFLLILLVFVCIFYYTFRLNFDFTTIEPETMMWYRFIQLNSKPYSIFLYLFLALAITFSFLQFLPELIQKRVRVTVHLPFSIEKIVFFHTILGLVLLSLILSILAVANLFINNTYYPYEVVLITLKDMIIFSCIAVVTYLLTASLIVEQNRKILILKAIFTAIFIGFFIKDEYVFVDFVVLFLSFFVSIFLLLDSFYSVKQQRISNIFKTFNLLLTFAILYLSFLNYQENYKKEFNKYYIFYSDILDDFVYQKNFGEHRFEYGAVNKKITFSQKEYEDYLPFVYWSNLEIQKKLPINVKDKLYTKEDIKASKLGFEYSYKSLKNQEIKLYPLFNPNSNIGMIKFSEEYFGIFKDKAKIYNYDTKFSATQTDILNSLLDKNGFSYPATNIFGKTTNLKPFDLGYLVLDSKNELYNISKKDDEIFVKKVQKPEDEKIVYINIVENRQKRISGYAISENSNFYLLTWDFEFIKLEMNNFDYKNMRLKFIADPKHYLIRYDDEKSYFASIFDKESFEKITEIEIN